MGSEEDHRGAEQEDGMIGILSWLGFSPDMIASQNTE